MLFKLAFSSIRHRWKDYLLLFSGLAISSAIFYLFETIASNSSFLQLNGQTVSHMIGYVFSFGSVLLCLLTLIYLNYANSFLLSMRQRDYGLFIMLGTRKKRIGRLIWLETMLLGAAATILGVIIGVALSMGLSNLVTNFLGAAARHYQPWWLPAFGWTLVVYLGLFFLAAGWNTVMMTKKPVLQLLKAERQSDFRVSKPIVLMAQLIIGLILLVIGYYVMMHPLVYKQYTILIALVTLSGGTFLLFKAVIVSLLQWLIKLPVAKKGLNGFTLAQLRFRVADYTKVLTGITMMFAMALGAITVGSNLHKTIENNARVAGAYDLRIVDPSTKQLSLIKQLSLQEKREYTFSKQGNNLIFSTQQFANQQLETVQRGETVSDYTMKKIANSDTSLLTLALTNYLGEAGSTNNKIVIQANSTKTGSQHKVLFIRTNGLAANAKVLKKIANIEKNKYSNTTNLWLGAWTSYEQISILYSGLEFMAMLLGISFLAMLASCLMFKILSGSFADIPRYQLLRKLGTREGKLRSAVRREISVLFILPAVLGVVHVLFGLKLFSTIIANPYQQLWIPFGIFGLIYFAYYCFLSVIYQRVVLKKEVDK